MKPTRGLGTPGGRSVSREKRGALLSLATLLVLLGSMALYQRWGAQPEPTPEAVTPSVSSADNEALTEGEDAAVETESPAEEATGETAPPDVLSFPLEGEPQIVAPFGPWYSEVFEDYRTNTGIGLRASPGDPVLAAATGTVTSVGDDPFDGRVVTVRHRGGMETRYGGLAEVAVTVGQQVNAGELLGEVGSPGPARSNLGSHLFFEVSVNDEVVDPGRYFSQ